MEYNQHPSGRIELITELDLAGKWIISTDSICDGEMPSENDHNSLPVIYETKLDAYISMFDSAAMKIAGMDFDELQEFIRDNDVQHDHIDKMHLINQLIYDSKADQEGFDLIDAVEGLFSECPALNYFEDSVMSTDGYVVNRKTVVGNDGIHVAGISLIDYINDLITKHNKSTQTGNG